MSIVVTDEDLAIRLRDLLKISKTSQRDVCLALAIPYRTMQSYMSGTTRIPALFLIQFAAYLGIETDFIVSGSFRPRMTESKDAIRHALEEVGLVPHNGPRVPVAERLKVFEQIHTATGIFREAYNQYCMEGLALSKSDKKDS